MGGCGKATEPQRRPMSGTINRLINGVFNLFPISSGNQDQGAKNIPVTAEFLREKIAPKLNLNVARDQEYEAEFQLYASYFAKVGSASTTYKWQPITLIKTKELNETVRGILEKEFAPSGWVQLYWNSLYAEMQKFETESTCFIDAAYAFGAKVNGTWSIGAIFFEAFGTINQLQKYHRGVWLNRSLRATWDTQVIGTFTGKQLTP